MIVSSRDDWLRDFFVEDVRSKKIPSDLESRLFRKIQMIDDATTDQDLRMPPSNHFEKLRGNLEGFHSIRVNKQWRLIFRWDGGRGEAAGVYPARFQAEWSPVSRTQVGYSRLGYYNCRYRGKPDIGKAR